MPKLNRNNAVRTMSRCCIVRFDILVYLTPYCVHRKRNPRGGRKGLGRQVERRPMKQPSSDQSREIVRHKTGGNLKIHIFI